MRLLLQSAMIFFGTLMAAGLLALGEPQPWPAAAAREPAPSLLLVLGGSWLQPTTAPAGR